MNFIAVSLNLCLEESTNKVATTATISTTTTATTRAAAAAILLKLSIKLKSNNESYNPDRFWLRCLVDLDSTEVIDF